MTLNSTPVPVGTTDHTTELHEAIKDDNVLWSRLVLRGIQPSYDIFPDLELRNCICGSTLAREVLR